MDQDQLRSLFEQVRDGAVDVDARSTACATCRSRTWGSPRWIIIARLRHGMPEVIFAKGKTPDQVVAIAEQLLENARNVLITRADPECAAAVTSRIARRRILSAVRRDPFLARPDDSRQGQDRRGLRRHQRHAGGGRGAGHRRSDGQRSGCHPRYRRGRHSPPDAATASA